MSVLTEVGTAARTIVESVGPAVVRIGRNGGRGNGLVLGPRPRGDERPQPAGRPGDGDLRRRPVAVGDVAGVDVDGDLAVIDVDTDEAPAIEWASGAAGVGDVVFALSRSAGGGVRVSFGLVSAADRRSAGPRGRRIAGSWSTPPRSCGAARAVRSSTPTAACWASTPTGWATASTSPSPPATISRQRLDGLAAGETPRARRLGVGVAPAGVARRLRQSVGLPARDGLLVRVVEPGGPADQAGIQPGDLIVSGGGAGPDHGRRPVRGARRRRRRGQPQGRAGRRRARGAGQFTGATATRAPRDRASAGRRRRILPDERRSTPTRRSSPVSPTRCCPSVASLRVMRRVPGAGSRRAPARRWCCPPTASC